MPHISVNGGVDQQQNQSNNTQHKSNGMGDDIESFLFGSRKKY